MNLGLLHLHARKRLAQDLEPVPATTQGRRTLDLVMYGVGIVQPLALVPQVTAIYVNHHTAGVSILTWGMLTVFNCLWFVYGIVHKEPPIYIGNILLMVLDLAIVFGVLFV